MSDEQDILKAELRFDEVLRVLIRNEVELIVVGGVVAILPKTDTIYCSYGSTLRKSSIWIRGRAPAAGASPLGRKVL